MAWSAAVCILHRQLWYDRHRRQRSRAKWQFDYIVSNSWRIRYPANWSLAILGVFWAPGLANQQRRLSEHLGWWRCLRRRSLLLPDASIGPYWDGGSDNKYFFASLAHQPCPDPAGFRRGAGSFDRLDSYDLSFTFINLRIHTTMARQYATGLCSN